MRKIILVLILSFIPFLLSAQTYNMSNNTVTNSSGTLYDSGGPNGNYTNNQDLVFTICPTEPLECLNLTFTSFSLENTYDYLTIYAGASTFDPPLGTYTGSNIPSVIQTSTDCLTLQFSSDGTVADSGFAATWGEGECPPTLEDGGDIPPCPDANIAANDTTVCPGSCVDFEVEITETASTTSYIAENIPYEPLPFDSGTIQDVPEDDTWSNVVNMGFNFCFYGNTYNQLVVGTNGVISFNTNYANQYFEWEILNGFPSNAADMPRNCIAAPYHDIDPAVGGVLRYGTIGEAPCRIFVITFQNVPMFSGDCNNLLATQQIVLYETSNIIETYIENKPICVSWNNGTAIHGIQNAAGTQATVVPGRNYPALWTATNDGKRFRPTGGPTHIVIWYENGVTPIENSENITVCPTEETFYTAEVTYINCDGSTIVANDTINVMTGAPFEVVATQNDVSCSTENNGSIILMPTGGSGNYSYNWSNFQTTPTINDLEAGTYTVTITDDMEPTCPQVESYTIALSPPLIADITSTDAVCDGTTGSSIDLMVSGGTTASGTYTYNWSGGLPNIQDHNNVAQGNYTVTVTDDTNCTVTASTFINASSALTITLTTDAADCGLSNGSLNVIINGGTPLYTYDWNDDSLDDMQNPVNVPAGTYSVTVSDINGCSDNATITINDNPPPTVSIVGIDANCGQASGQAIATAENGTPPYAYLWNTMPPQNMPTVDNLLPGTYSVTVTDTNGCTIIENVTIGDTASPTISATPTDANCSLPDGSATAMAENGVPPYSFLWNTVPPQNTATANSLVAGTYGVTVTDDIGCTAETTVVISENPAPTATTNVENANCGQEDGSANVVVSGGLPPYTYEWDTTIPMTTSNLENLAVGTYTVTVTDANGCTIEASATIAANPLPTVLISGTDASCGNTNGSLFATANDGTPPYTYSWLAPINSNNPIINNVQAGTYSVIVTDNNGCTISETIDIVDSSIPTIDEVTTTNSNCNQANGSASVNVSSGVGNITYFWENGETTAEISNLLAGSYGITVSDDLGCSAEAVAIVSDAGAPTAEISSINPTCNEANGAVSVAVTNTSDTYIWNGDASLNAPNLNNVPAGEYTVVVTDINGCIVTASIELTSSSIPVATIEAEATLCGLNSGSATAIAESGTPPYTYLWSENNQQTESIENLAAGEYFLTVTDSNGCTTFASTTVDSPEALEVVTNEIPATCGLPNGEAGIGPINGQMPYTYMWQNNLATTSIATELLAGDYNVTITDANNCTTSVVVTVTEILPPILNTSKTDATCNLANGSISVSANNGTSSFSYLWSDANQQTTSTATNLVAGNYTVTVTDENGCEQIISESILNVEMPTATLTFTEATCGNNNATVSVSTLSGIPPFSYAWSASTETTETITGIAPSLVSVTVTDANNCTFVEQIDVTTENSPTATITDFVSATCGNANGSATVLAVGGIPPYTYMWNTNPPQNNLIANNLAAGNYVVTITDGNGCMATTNINLANIAAPTISLSAIDATCQQANGEAMVTVNGGTPPFMYLWNDENAQTTISATNLLSGNHSVTVTDANNCSAVESINIGDSDIPSINISTANASCGQNDGEATASGLGGISPYNFVWDENANNQTTATATNLFAGAYSVTITDGNGCQNTEIANIIDENAPSATTSTTNEICGQENGTASVATAGGFPPFTYLWNDTNAQTTETATNLAAGTYSIAVTDGNGCVATATAIVEETIGAILEISNISASCGENNASASVVANGGLPPYTYLWNDETAQTNPTAIALLSGTYEVVVTDANGCIANISTTITDTNLPTVNTITTNSFCGQAVGQATAQATNGTSPYTYLWNDANAQTDISATGLSAGIYEVTITDNVGCTASASATINDEGSPTLTTTSVMPTCNTNNGEASVLVVGNSAPYTHLWNDETAQTTETAINLAAGTYIVDVTDVNNCMVSAEVTLINIDSPTLSLSSEPATCEAANGTATALTDGIAMPYTYTWSDANAQTTETATNLEAGTYFVTLTDINNCETVGEILVENTAGMTLSTTSISASCQFANGEATAIPQNGTLPYTFLWNVNGNSQTTETITNLFSGNYEVTVSDANNCTASAIVNVADTPPPTVTAISTNANCGLNNGTATATAENGIAPYTFLWNADANNQTTATASNLAPANYEVTITDANDCTVATNVTVNDTGLPSIALTATNPTCELNNGSITTNISSGAPPYTYLWNDANAQTTAIVTNLVAGNYVVTITDTNNCAIIDSITLTDNGNPTAVLSSIGASCGESNGSATVVASAGTAPYTYAWSDSTQTSETAINLAQGNYSVTITDANDCAVIENILVENIDAPTATTTTIAATCALADGSATVAAINGVVPYTYLWNDANEQTTETAINLPTGIYEVTVTDANDCIVVAEAEVIGIILSPIITCGENTASSVTFEWENVTGAIEYEISIDGDVVEIVDATTLIYTITDLVSGQNVEISIVAVGEAACGSSEATNHTCQALACPSIPLIINGLDDFYCGYDDNVVLSGEPMGGIFSGTGIAETTFSPSLAGVGTHNITYSYTQANCEYDTTYVVQVSNVMVSTTPTTTVLETSESVILDAIATSGLNGEISYEWSPAESLDCDNCESVMATPIENTEYTVVATDEYGCSANAVSFINFGFSNILVIPNAFSPNGDNKNDIFKVKGSNIAEVELHIYNRWGQLVFETKTIELAQGWNGKFKEKECEIGTYVFYVVAKFADGSEEFTKGNVTLIK
ncbi:MAG: gliding motility-associated C-terminal domain-containing protein [Chitinophagales bacterium]